MAGNPLASLFVKLGLDPADFNKGIDAVNQKAATLGKTGITTGQVFKAGMATVGVALGAVTVAGAQAERAQGEFMAATGKSRQEAEAFVSSMDGLAGTSGAVGKSFTDITSAGTEVARQFQLGTAETANLTEQFLQFSKVTGSDATQAVNSFDDTLDAFHEPASKATDLMNQLVASNQKFGTEVGPDTVTMLGKMAPALQAMGSGLDDGVALLNLMENSGLDTSAALKGIVAASQKMPDGMNLTQFLQHLQDMKNAGLDPTTEAVKVFGNKAGVGLANSIIAGQHGLDQYRVSAQDAGQAVSDAADNMLTTGDRIKGLADKFVAGAREIGQQFGPALTGAASAATLLAPIAKPFVKIGAQAAGAFADSFKGKLGGLLSKGLTVGKGIGAKIAAPIASAVSGALSRLAGSPAIGGAMDKLGGFMGGRLGGGMATAFKAAGILALIAVAIDEWGKLQQQIAENQKAVASIDSETSAFLATMPSTADVQAKIDALQQVPEKLTGIQGALYSLGQAGEGNVLGSVFDAAFGANPAQVADDKIKQLTDYLQTHGADQVQSGIDATTAPIDNAAQTVSDGFDAMVQSWEDGSKAVIDQGQTLAEFDPDLGRWLTGKDFEDAAPDVQDAVNSWIDTQNTAIDQGAKDTAAALDKMQTQISDKLQGIQDAFNIGTDTKKKKNISGAKRLQQMADDIDQITKRLHESIAANDPVNTAYWESALIDATNKYNTAKQSINVDSSQIEADVNAATTGAAGDFLHLGNKATDAASTINQAAQNVNLNPAVNATQTAADAMRDNFRMAGNAAGLVPSGIQANIGDTRTAAQRLAAALAAPIQGLDPYSWGTHLAERLIAGLRSQNKHIAGAANRWAGAIADPLHHSTPPRIGPLRAGTVEHWGPHLIERWLGPMERSGIPKVSRFANRLAAAMAAAGNAVDTARPVHHDVAPLPWHHRHRDSSSSDSSSPDRSNTDGVTINVTVNGNIYGTGGVKQLATDLQRYYRRSTRGGARYVGAF